jgi:hypothetical protein
MRRWARARLLGWAAAGIAALATLSFGADRAWAAGGAFQVDDVEVGEVGACKVESWASFAGNTDFIGVVSPACVANLGRPVELNASFARFRSGGDWGSVLVTKGKTNLIPVEPNKVGLALIAGTAFDLVNRNVNGVFVNVPLTWQLHEQFRVNLNGGWFWDPSVDQHVASWGAGFEWNFVKPLTLIGEVFGFAGGPNPEPRFQLGLRYTPIETLDIDVIYGRNLTGEQAHWITVGLNVRFNPIGK